MIPISGLSFSRLIAAFLATIFVLILSYLPAVDLTERRFLDLSFRIRGEVDAHPDIVIIEINDQSLENIGAWPWPRLYHATLLRALNQYKPKAVFFDILFPEASKKENDEAFAQEIEKAGNVVLPFYFPGKNLQEMVRKPSGLPIEAFRKNAAMIGYVNSFPDEDGYVRDLPFHIQIDEQSYYHASLAAAYLHANDASLLNLFSSEEEVIINFPGPYNTFKIIPFEYVIKLFASPATQSKLASLKDKIIIVGHTAAGTAMDLKPSPYSSQYPGVALQASAIHTALTHSWIQQLPKWGLFLLLFLLCLLIISLTHQLNPIQSFLYTLAILIIIFEISQIAFQYFHLWLPFFVFFLLGLSTYLTVIVIQFVKVRIEREMLSRELGLASRIQKTFLPAALPSIPGFEAAATSNPARYVGGDLYDVFPLVKPSDTPNEKQSRWGICIGDVSGKGVPAALFMAKAIGEFRREATGDVQPHVVLRRLNEQLSSGGFSGLFITVLYGILDTQNKKLVFANGGHEPVFHFSQATQQVSLISTQEGGPLGIDPESSFDVNEISYQTGDALIVISDGIKEAMNRKREIFGNDRICQSMKNSAQKSADAMMAFLLEDIDRFVATAPQHDDLTVICLKAVS